MGDKNAGFDEQLQPFPQIRQDTALRWGCIQELAPKRISRGQKGRDIILGIKVYFL